MAIAGLVLGIASIPLAVCCWPIGIILGILGVVFGFLGRSQVSKEPALYTGGGMALGGLICGFIGVGLGILIIIAWIAGLADWTYNFEDFESSLGGLRWV